MDAVTQPTPGIVPLPPRPTRLLAARWAALLGCLWLAAFPLVGAPLRLDMFVGYDGIVPQGTWFPISFEVENDGPGFTATFEITPSQLGSGQRRVMEVELPSGTTKRFTLPVHNSATYTTYWDVTVRDERGRVRAEIKNQRVRRVQEPGVPLAGALSRTPPSLPPLKGRDTDQQPIFARLQTVTFPDHPLTLEGLNMLYLSSERALELRPPQVNALLAWLHAGGHLVVGIEQLNHLSGPGEWLARLLPAEITGLNTAPVTRELQEWVAGPRRFDGRDYRFDGSRPARPGGTTSASDTPFSRFVTNDTRFEAASMQTASLRLRDGRVLIGTESAPLAVMARRGRGQLTLLAFAPELEPFRSWNNAPIFWAKLSDLPESLLRESGNANRYYAGRGLDGVFGAMVDSEQVRKLPVGWLLLLLVAYLIVIGPLDQYWLKKINKQMLTWITFPLYVVIFSALIYFIGYKLRAGETEWNELHVVDVIPHGPQTDLRGRTYASIYSPANARYRVASDQPVATMRGESMGNLGGSGQESSRANVRQVNNTFEAELIVPVWTSQLFVSDWWNQGQAPLTLERTPNGFTVANRLNAPVARARLVHQGQVYELGALAPGQSRAVELLTTSPQPLQSFVQTHGGKFENAVNSRRGSFGDDNAGRLRDITNAVMAASFVTLLNSDNPQYNHFRPPPGLDLNDLAERGDTLLLAFAADHAPVKSLNRFNARRHHQHTLYRVALAAD